MTPVGASFSRVPVQGCGVMVARIEVRSGHQHPVTISTRSVICKYERRFPWQTVLTKT